MDLLERIDCWGGRAPDRIAHASGGRTLSYAQLVRRSNEVAGYLARELPDDKSPVIVHGHKEPEMLLALLGCIKAGHPYVPIDTIVPAARVRQIQALTRAQMILTPKLIRQVLPGSSARPTRRLTAADPFYILFTSGSTGEPKGVVITLGCLTNFLDWTLARQDFQAGGETFLNQVLYSFDVSVMDTYWALLTGGTVCSITREEVANPKYLFETLRTSGVTIWVSTPSFAQMCLVEKSFNAQRLPRLRRLFLAGEVVSPELAARLLERFPGAQVWNAYGPTEATVVVTWLNVTREVLARYPVVPIGLPLAGNRILLLDAAGQAVPPGQRGELTIVGPSVSPGYLGRPDLTALAFFEHAGSRAYRTGDWGRLRDGLVFYEGRRDNQLKLHGYRIELGEVEVHLRALPGVTDAAVLPVLKQAQPESLTAFILWAERPAGSDFELSNRLRAQLAEHLPAYMLPHKFRFLEAFPLNPNGKADRRKLAELLA
jgi:D-alanine--poly(phosphoribitol) ligase subunit 1